MPKGFPPRFGDAVTVLAPKQVGRSSGAIEISWYSVAATSWDKAQALNHF
ncbi:hypothetical protein OZ401_005029 (plasmid) [Candidatus Chlorohelix allophototropha]|uniref:Uncharacterized protein n=1 Tax=Candidatus Chlorohelix allophototropha TaxID=3003348 RepID=A0ABY9BAR8_9CHLR|nr:hypothetical protein OZ401_005029 [Chloroflexota bacterium L227-S17]